MKRILSFMFIACVIGTSVGCATVTEGDRQLVDQIVKASEIVINGVVIGPDAIQAIMDVKKNSEVLQANLGSPKTPAPYSPKASAEAREKAREQHESPWWKVLVSSLAGAVLSGGAFRFLAPIFPALFAGPVGTTMNALVEGIARVRQKAAQNPAGTLSIQDIMTILTSLQDQAGVKEFVSKQAKAVESKFKIELPKIGLP